jgi:hypothetical protein
MDNPWIKVSEAAPYVLPEDQEVLERLGRMADFEFDVLPEPFLGCVEKAKLLLLNLNPGFHDEDLPTHARSDFSNALRKNLRQEPTRYPFYLLDPEFSDTPGYAWWNGKLRELVERCGRDQISQNVACIEFFAYHSRRWRGLAKPIPSQSYAVQLVQGAMEEKKLILLMRASRKWFDAVSGLESYPRLLKLKNPQNVSVSNNNVADGKFEELVQEVQGS